MGWAYIFQASSRVAIADGAPTDAYHVKHDDFMRTSMPYRARARNARNTLSGLMPIISDADDDLYAPFNTRLHDYRHDAHVAARDKTPRQIAADADFGPMASRVSCRFSRHEARF